LGVVALTTVVAFVSAETVWYVAHGESSGPSLTLKRFTIDPRPTGLNESYVPLALSPDGTKLVYAAGTFQGSQLYVRALDQLDPKPLDGTLGAGNPFFSPDGQWIGFVASASLKKVPVSGGAVVTLCSLPKVSSAVAFNATTGGASWASDGAIVFASGFGGGLWKVSEAGGNPQAVTTLDAGKGEVGHIWPEVLPDGKGILFTVLTSSGPDAYRVVVERPGSKTSQILVEGGTFAHYAPTGHLVYAQAETLFAAPFDLERLAITGPAVSVLDGVWMDSGSGNARVTFAREGTVAFDQATAADRRSLVWVDRDGATTTLSAIERRFVQPSLSPDGKRLVVQVRNGARSDLWLYQLDTATFSRMTFDGSAEFPEWTPDGQKVVFDTVVAGRPSLLLQTVDGNQPAEQLLSAGTDGVWPGSWSPDGRTLAFMQWNPTTAGDINVIEPQGNREPKPFIQTPATEWGGKLSPDGHWMAYISNESGRWEVYVQPFPSTGARRQISTDGGTEVIWARSGRELFYRNGQRLMAVAIDTNPTFAARTPRPLFEGPYILGEPGGHNYDVSPDGRRFVMIKPGEGEVGIRPIQIMLNWFTELKRRVPTK